MPRSRAAWVTFTPPSLTSFTPSDEFARLLRGPPAAAEDHEVVTVALELTDSSVTILPQPVQRVQVDVREQGRNHPALRNATPCLLPSPVDDYPGTQPLDDQLQHPTIAHASPHETHEDPVVHAVEVALDVRIQDPPAPDQRLLDRQHRLPRTTLGPIPVRARQEVRLEQRLDDDPTRLLDHPIANGRDPQRALSTIGLRDLHPQHRAGAIPPRLQVLRELAKVRLDPEALHILDAHAIDARAAPVRSHLYPGPPQHVGPDDAVVQSVKPSSPTPLGREVPSALEFS